MWAPLPGRSGVYWGLCFSGSGSGFPHRMSALGALVATALFVLIAQAPMSAQRAAIMIGVVLLGRMIGRPPPVGAGYRDGCSGPIVRRSRARLFARLSIFVRRGERAGHDGAGCRWTGELASGGAGREHRDVAGTGLALWYRLSLRADSKPYPYAICCPGGRSSGSAWAHGLSTDPTPLRVDSDAGRGLGRNRRSTLGNARGCLSRGPLAHPNPHGRSAHLGDQGIQEDPLGPHSGLRSLRGLVATTVGLCRLHLGGTGRRDPPGLRRACGVGGCRADRLS